ncbi:hypothetical protein SPBR_07227 [Sporothrix brasiliensis 5110]|uniref:Integral membrane protein n=1 Tax=Sporothrix brasiliensis 5110 TaxID=1398154 RepID=A0A0C2IMZ8_9PEZI|nr:uncharacterized protein SPBR_07227 [Sporothrix brasiliensis 5110]KIH88385.1 hypothetical protein SPBR_07227 [Sporothrix brasiliensis 5110]
MPIPIPIPIPVSSPGRADSLRDNDAPARQERERSPVDSLRSSRISLNSNPLPPRSSGVFGHGPNSSPSYRQPAFFINIPSTAADDEIAVDVQIVTGGGPREWYPERPPAATRQGAERPPADRAEKPLVPLYKRYAEDVYYGRVAGLPECPRIQFSTKYRDWRTLTPYKDFLICPTCYDAGFARTQWRNEFVPVTGIDPKLKTNCIYGAMPWYQVAFFFVRAFQMPTLSLLRTMFNRDEELRLPCPGPRRIAGRWFTVQDPLDGRPVSKFTTCEQCATAITVLFPRLKSLLQDNNPTPHDTTNVCSLYYEPERKRLWKFIDVLESTNNASMVNNAPVDVNEFINKILDITHYEECKRDIPVRQRKWYWMRTMPDFVVCQECFDEVVYPVVTTYRGVAGDFYKEPKELDIAACHLYSQRMRDIFKRACQNNDKEYLAKKLEERADVAADITARIQRLPKASSADDVEQMKLMAEWKKWE